MSEYQKSYFILWNAIDKALAEMKEQNYGFAKELLLKAQVQAEEAYINWQPEESAQQEALFAEKDRLAREKAALSLEKKEGEGFRLAGLERKKELEERLLADDGKDETLRARLDEVRLAAEKAMAEKAEAEKENGVLNLSLYV